MSHTPDSIVGQVANDGAAWCVAKVVNNNRSSSSGTPRVATKPLTWILGPYTGDTCGQNGDHVRSLAGKARLDFVGVGRAGSGLHISA